MKRAYRLYLILLFAQLLVAFVCGPHSCEWGNEVYFYFGVAGLFLALLFAVLQKGWPAWKRLLIAFLFLTGSILGWWVGFLTCGFSLLCRLF